MFIRNQTKWVRAIVLVKVFLGVRSMVEIFKFSGNRFELIEKVEVECWINIIKPNNDELKRLSKRQNIPLNFLMDSLDIDERARVEKEGNIVLVILRIPVLNTENPSVPFITLPLGIILMNKVVITICSLDVKELLGLTQTKRKWISQSPIKFLLLCLENTVLLYLEYLKEINREYIKVEKELHKAMKNEQLLKLLDMEKSLVFFTTSLRSNEFMMEQLKKSNIIEMDDTDKEMFNDIIIDNKQALEMANIYSNILSGMMDAFASVISNNLNIVMKLLTSITIILMIPTLIASIYGMNVKLPFQNSPHAFLIIIGISALLTIVGILIFKKRKWF